jgi:ABC-type oligopeptide transport system substrate-binding subunit
MKKKRFIAVALSALAFISLFACSEKTTNTKTTTDKKTTQVTTQKTTSKKTTTSSHEEQNGVNFLVAKNDYNLLFAQHVSGGTLYTLNLCINYKNALIFQIMRDHSTDTIKSVSVA